MAKFTIKRLAQGEAQSQEQKGTGGCNTALNLGHRHKVRSLRILKGIEQTALLPLRGRDTKTLASSPRLREQAPATRVANTATSFPSTGPLVSRGARFLRLYAWHKFFRPGFVDFLDANPAKTSFQKR